MVDEEWGYSAYNSYNRFPNLDGIEAKIVEHLVKSQSKYADTFWKILKYNDLYALSKLSVSEAERRELVNHDNGEPTSKRVFFAPFVDDAWENQCSSVYIYVETIDPFDQTRATVGVTIETIVHCRISAIVGDGDPILNPQANPNESDSEGSIVVPFKNRATVLLKCILAELNGLYLDGIGYLQFINQGSNKSKVEMPLWNSRSVYGHSTKFQMVMSGCSSDPNGECNLDGQ